MKLTEIANRISVHLARFEADKKINKLTNGTSPYYHSHAYRGGKFVCVRYVLYQCTSSLTREQALAYLAWLDDGNVGKHFKFLQAAGK